MSDTPRTDVKARYPKITDGLERIEISWKAAVCGCSVPSSFARTLERENVKLEAELCELKRQIADAELIPVKVAEEYSISMWRFGLGLIVQPIDIKQYVMRRQKGNQREEV